jgi:DNA polymerase-1
MEKKLFLLDGMALVYRAHFAFIRAPILTSTGFNTSAIYGFANTLLDIIGKQSPTHLAVAFDTAAPTARHTEFAEYKAHREAMPEELSAALPHIKRLIDAFNIPRLELDGFEADDIIGTLVKRAEREDFRSFMVTSDKDFGQLVTDKTFIFKPGRAGDDVEILGVPEVLARWNIQSPAQVVDVLALMGDASDNIPGVPGIGEKTAMKLITEFGSVENLLARTGELKGKLKENLENHRADAELSKRLATINCNVPCPLELEPLQRRPFDDDALKALFVEFEFNSLGRRLFGEEFKAGRGGAASNTKAAAKDSPSPRAERGEGRGEGQPSPQSEFSLFGETQPGGASVPASRTERLVSSLAPPNEDGAHGVTRPTSPDLKTIADVPHEYHIAATPAERKQLIQTLAGLKSFCFDTETTGLDPKQAKLVGLSFSFAAHTGHYVPIPQEAAAARKVLEEFRAVLEDERIEKVGHNLKFDLSVLKWQGFAVRGRLFDTMIAHSLVEPEQRHGMDYLAEVYLGYTPVPISKLIGEKKSTQTSMADVPLAQIAEYAAEDADVTWQLRAVLESLLKQRGQERVFFEVESPLLPVLVDMEYEGIRVDAAALAEFAELLAKEMAEHEAAVYELAGTKFNLNSPRQLGQILFDVLKIAEKPKKTKTGQYTTDEQTLTELAGTHTIVQRLLDFRTATKLKSTYADALPEAIWPATGRVHTTYQQVATSTGRLNSTNPNLQNIPIRTERGQEIRKAFVPRDAEHALLSADYSQIELRIIAALSREPAMLEAFASGLDIHAATAARVFGVALDAVTPEMRRKAKMVNFGIIYGISAFGLAQRLGIPRGEAAEIIAQYFAQFPGIRGYLDTTIAFARQHGYVETVTGRRRYLRDINSANGTIRAAAERNAINAPIQGTAADMIKLAMTAIHRELAARKLKTRMLLQVHDELVFDLYRPEEKEVRELVAEKMKTAIALDAPVDVEIGTGDNWLAAH